MEKQRPLNNMNIVANFEVRCGLPVIRPEPELRVGCDSILHSSISTAVLGMVARQKLFFGVAYLAVTASTGKGGEGSVVLWSRAMCSLHEVNR